MAGQSEVFPEIPASFLLPPKTRMQTFKTVLRLLFPLTWLAKGVTGPMNALFGRAVGRQIIKKPYVHCRPCGDIVPELHSETQLSKIHEYALVLNAQKGWGYKIDGIGEKNSRLRHAYLKTHDGALIEHSCIAPTKWLNKKGQIQDRANAKVVCFFPGRTRNHLHELPVMLLRSHDMNCVFASFTYRGLMELKDLDNREERSYYRHLLGWTQQNAQRKYETPSRKIIEFFKKIRFKKIERSEDLISDGMAFVGYYLKQGLRPSQITIDAFSMGGMGIKVADRYRKIFKRFQSPNWHQDSKLFAYAQKFFGIEEKEELIRHVNACKNEGFEFNVWADRTFSTMTRVVLGRLRTTLDLAKWPRLGKVLFWIFLPFCDALLWLLKWQSNILSSIRKLNPKLVSVVAIESPLDPNTGKLQYESDTMVHFQGSSLYQRLLEVGSVKIWKKLYEWLWKFEKQDLLRSHSPDTTFDRRNDLSHYYQKAEHAYEERLGYTHDDTDNAKNGKFVHAACKEDIVLHRGRAEKNSENPEKPYTFYHLFKKFVNDCDKNRTIIREDNEKIARKRTLSYPKVSYSLLKFK